MSKDNGKGAVATLDTKTQPKAEGKPKATKVDVTQLVILAAYAKTYSTGKRGFFGKAMDPRTGQRYQLIGAVEIK